MQPAAWHPRGAGPAPGTAPGAPWALQGGILSSERFHICSYRAQAGHCFAAASSSPTSPGLDAPGGTDEGC